MKMTKSPEQQSSYIPENEVTTSQAFSEKL
jgi:hypothetical protein